MWKIGGEKLPPSAKIVPLNTGNGMFSTGNGRAGEW
jgi:hypothetical protein